ncbi:D-alanyl-D-alanine carboxypeptidase family protein [Nonomuraea sp. NPDC059007]|uniref:D-alanyl-D-alanine carboxypeptidase family protein n=1 Tax=Nonomuraea sp. NPDC059007 TaxID=3346692 RepID=UPI0036B52014
MPTDLKNRLNRALLGLAATAVAMTACATAAQAIPPVGPDDSPESRSHVQDVAAHAPTVLGRAAHVIDTKTGKVYFSKKADLRMPVASLTKVMTAYTVLKEAKPGDVVKVTSGDVRYASKGGASVAGLRAGDRLTVENLLYALMLPSGADAAHTLARVYGPGVDAFTAKMNLTARELGMRDTRYVNADGMPTNGGGYSTARDQARLAQAALGVQALKKVASSRYRSVAATAEHRAYSWRNTNRLLGKPGAVGLKTGYTRAAGYTLSFAADREGRQLAGVILGETSSTRRFQTAQRLLDWAVGGQP